MATRPAVLAEPRGSVGIATPPPRRRRVSTEFWMLLPSLLALAALSLFPFFYLIWMSFCNVSLIGGIHLDFVGLANWQTLITDRQLWASWGTTLVYVGGTLVIEVALGIAVALAITSLPVLQNITLTLVLFPMFVAPVVVGLLGQYLTNSTYGLYAYVLHRFGFFTNADILGTTASALPAVMLMDIWEWTPLIIMIVAAGRSALPREPLEAAAIDGASGFALLRYIVLPMLKPTILVALLIRSMDAIRYYDIIWVTTAGGPADVTKVVAIRLYETAFRFFNLGYAAAIGLTMLFITIVLGKIFVRYMTGDATRAAREGAV